MRAPWRGQARNCPTTTTSVALSGNEEPVPRRCLMFLQFAVRAPPDVFPIPLPTRRSKARRELQTDRKPEDRFYEASALQVNQDGGVGDENLHSMATGAGSSIDD